MEVSNTLEVGHLAEIHACEYLQTNGLQLIQRNFRAKTGEIDLIMQDENDIVFIEVRVRNNKNYGNALASVDARKQTKIVKTATYFLCQQKWMNKVHCRFDVVGISYNSTKPTMDWVKNAFPANNF